jgi:two-component system sensor histidine kinase KdpD
VDQAINNFFKTVNLIALRELALREIADDVDERLESWQRNSSLRGPWRRQEVIFVCMDANPQAERLIRRGFRIAYRLKAAWYVTYVTYKQVTLTSEMKERLEALKKLTVRLGGTFEIIEAGHRKQIPEALVNKANAYKATQIIVGQSKLSIWKELWKGSIVKNLLRRARHMDVLVVADYDRLHAAIQEPFG